MAVLRRNRNDRSGSKAEVTAPQQQWPLSSQRADIGVFSSQRVLPHSDKQVAELAQSSAKAGLVTGTYLYPRCWWQVPARRVGRRVGAFTLCAPEPT